MPRKKAVQTTEAEAIETMTEDIKAEEATAETKAAEETPAKPKRTPGRKKTAKAESVKEAPAKEKKEKAEAPQKEAKKAAADKPAAKKAEVKNTIHVQYGGKSLAQEDLIKSAKDIWKYDLKRKVGELTSIELYVKPEENKVYYVMNDDVTGCFDI